MFLQSDWFLKFASFVLLPTALAVKQFVPSHTIAYSVADVVIGIAAGLGMYSTTGRAKADPLVK
jgi:hypothetical protein